MLAILEDYQCLNELQIVVPLQSENNKLAIWENCS